MPVGVMPDTIMRGVSLTPCRLQVAAEQWNVPSHGTAPVLCLNTHSKLLVWAQ